MAPDRTTVDRAVRKPTLTVLQTRILARTASGVKLKEIAKEEYLSLSEINRVTRDLKDRLGARNLAQAVLLACQNGLITPVDEKGISQPQSMLPKID